MITYSKGDLFDRHGVLVIPVNTVGVTGAGLAKAWAKYAPDNARTYREFCAAPPVPFEGGDILMMSGTPPTILVATKEHWRNPSRLEWIETGARHLAERSREPINIPILIPQLGCGLGGLDWPDVRAILVKHLEPNTNNTYVLFGPAPVAESEVAA